MKSGFNKKRSGAEYSPKTYGGKNNAGSKKNYNKKKNPLCLKKNYGEWRTKIPPSQTDCFYIG